MNSTHNFIGDPTPKRSTNGIECWTQEEDQPNYGCTQLKLKIYHHKVRQIKKYTIQERTELVRTEYVRSNYYIEFWHVRNYQESRYKHMGLEKEHGLRPIKLLTMLSLYKYSKSVCMKRLPTSRRWGSRVGSRRDHTSAALVILTHTTNTTGIRRRSLYDPLAPAPSWLTIISVSVGFNLRIW